MHLNNTEARLSVPQPSRDPYGTTPAVAATVWHRDFPPEARAIRTIQWKPANICQTCLAKNSAVIYIIGYTCGALGRMDTPSTQKTTN